jgi:hypothetical protein
MKEAQSQSRVSLAPMLVAASPTVKAIRVRANIIRKFLRMDCNHAAK